MKKMTLSEEDYLKAIYHLSRETEEGINTNAVAEKMQTKASSVTDMLRKLADKELVVYRKYQGVTLTDQGRLRAANIVRKHRLWEVFLVEKLEFGWDEVHDIAEQLEHVKSEALTEKLDAFLDFPRFDPHGDPIPDKDGNTDTMAKVLLAQAKTGSRGIVVGVRNSSDDFLRYLDKLQISLGTAIEVRNRESFDHSVEIYLPQQDLVMLLTSQVAHNIYIKSHSQHV